MRKLPEHTSDVFVLVARVAVGVVFIAHGGQKFFSWGIGGTTKSFAHMGIPLPGLSAWGATIIETFGGIALVLGIALPIVGVLLALDMLGALFLYHLAHGFFLSHGGFEYVLVLAAAALALGFHGGQYTVDRMVRGRIGQETRAAPAGNQT
jgi:putative oxidoreductase